MITYRKGEIRDRASYLAAAQAAFGADFETLLPKMYAPERDTAHLHEVAVDESGRVLGLVGVLPGRLHVAGASLRTGYLGTMGVHPDARGLGVMKQLMTNIMRDIWDMDCDLTLLDGLRQRYEYHGYTPAGVSWKVILCEDNVRHALKQVDDSHLHLESICPGTEREAEAAALHRRRVAHFDRDAFGFATACRSYGGQAWAALRDGAVIGFLVANAEGTYLSDLCAPDVDAAEAMLKAWFRERKVEELMLSLPDWEQPLLRRLATWAEEMRRTQAVNARILHYAPVVEALLRLKASYAALPDGAWAFEAEGQPVTIRVQSGVPEVIPEAENPVQLTALEANRLLLYPFPYEGMPEGVPAWFPLPLYASGPDGF